MLNAIGQLADRQDRFMEIETQHMESTSSVLEFTKRLAEIEEKHMQMTNKLLELSQRLIELGEKHMELTQELFREVKWLHGALIDIRDALGGGFEYYTANVVRAILRRGTLTVKSW